MLLTAFGADRSARRWKRGRGRLVGVALLASGVALAVATLAPTGSAAAQTVPTVPCAGCGPGQPGDGTRAWSFTEFVCQPTRGFIVQFGVGSRVDEPVNFSAGTALASVAVVPVRPVAAGVQPGQHRSTLLPEPATGDVKVRVVGIGARSGRTLLDNTRTLSCVCPEQASTTTSTTSSTSSTSSSSTTTPVQPTSVVATTEPVSTSPTFTLPSTGTSTTPIALGGLALVVTGLVAFAVVAFSRRAERSGEA